MNLGGLLNYTLDELPFVFLALVVAFTVHEFSHAYTAYLFGDATAQREGRVTLNPRAHLDVLGTLLIFIAGIGWAKPVPVNRSRFKHPRTMGIAVTFAGPLSNLLTAFIGIVIYYTLDATGAFGGMSLGVYNAVVLFLNLLVHLNLMLFLFNLIPLPPLDGYRIVEDLVPLRVREQLRQYEQWAILVFMLMVFIPPISRFTINPLFDQSVHIFDWMDSIVSKLFHRS